MTTMTTRSVPLAGRLPLSRPTSVRHRPFLEALQHVEYGHLTLITPEGERLEFSGVEKGPQAVWQFKDWKVADDVLSRGELGFADAYIDGRWDSPDVVALVTFSLLNSKALERFFYGKPLYALWLLAKSWLARNSVQGSRRNVTAHYDLGNDFYKLWLDESMTYSCALFEGDESKTLEEAQAAKYRRILNKLMPEPGEHILELGCGWGGFAETAARHGVRVTAITLSEEQAAYARERVKQAGLGHLVSVELVDYREVTGTFDYVVSIGMFEHVGEAYWPVYFKTVKERLKPGGRALIQSITLDDYLFEALHDHSGFIEHYIFPGGMLPSKSRFRAAAAKAGLECREMFGFGRDYAITLRRWLARFEAHKPEIRALGYEEPFMRLWRLYLASSVASFASHRTDVMQAELLNA